MNGSDIQKQVIQGVNNLVELAPIYISTMDAYNEGSVSSGLNDQGRYVIFSASEDGSGSNLSDVSKVDFVSVLDGPTGDIFRNLGPFYELVGSSEDALYRSLRQEEALSELSVHPELDMQALSDILNGADGETILKAVNMALNYFHQRYDTNETLGTLVEDYMPLHVEDGMVRGAVCCVKCGDYTRYELPVTLFQRGGLILPCSAGCNNRYSIRIDDDEVSVESFENQRLPDVALHY